MAKRGAENRALFTIVILVIIALLIFLLYRIVQTKISGGIFKGL